MNDRYDTFSQRFFAGIIDGMILTPLCFIEKIVENFADVTAIIIRCSEMIKSVPSTI